MAETAAAPEQEAAPEATPVVEAVQAETPNEVGGEVLDSENAWDDLVNHEENPESMTETELTPEKAPESEAAPAAEVIEPPAVVVEEEEPPKPEEVTPPQEQQQAPDPEAIKELRTQWVSDLTKQFADGLSEEDVVALGISPEKVLPKLAADIVAQAVDIGRQATLQMMQAHIPQVFQQMQQSQTQGKEGKEAFFNNWGELNKPEYQEKLLTIAQQYREANPTVPAEQFIKDVGTQAWIQVGLPVTDLATKLAGGNPAPTAAPVGSPTYSPASPGGASTPIAPKAPVTNEWDTLIDGDPNDY